VQRRYEDALYAEGGAALPMLLSEAQSLALWQEAIRASRWHGALLDVAQTAARAQQAGARRNPGTSPARWRNSPPTTTRAPSPTGRRITAGD
jgi:hypothetical protein